MTVTSIIVEYRSHIDQKQLGKIRHILIDDNPADILLVRESFRQSKTPIKLSDVKDGQEALDFMYPPSLSILPGSTRRGGLGNMWERVFRT